jgi:bacillithiol biosynthesis cysteine-adding enzyme BshC
MPVVDLGAAGLLPPIPAAFLAGYDLDLLSPLGFLAPGELPAWGAERPAGPAPGSPGDRRALAQGLAVANRGYGHPRADALAARLADPAVKVVIAGQQPGLFGGPLYTFSKMMAVARWAAALEARGEPAVPVFWVATEDHDWTEVTSAVFQTPAGPRSFDLGPDPEPLTPVGMRTFGPPVAGVLAALAAAAPGDLEAEWLQTLGRWYRPDARFGEAFCRLMIHLLGERCPLLVDAMHPALKAAERPWLRRLVERRSAVEEALAARDAALAERGFPLQVTPQRGASPLFLFQNGERRRVEWRGADGFALRGVGSPGGQAAAKEGRSGSVADLLRAIDDNPGVVSAGVLARPAVQDAVFGTALILLGPGELSYLPQAAAVYAALEVPAPVAALRPQALVLEERQLAKLGEAGVGLADLLGDPQALDRARAVAGGGDIAAPVRQSVEASIAALRPAALALDPNLERPYEKTREQILRALDLFAEKALAAAARKDEVQTRRLAQLREAVMPLGRFQERVMSTAYFGGRYGPRLAASFWEQMGLDPRQLQVVAP